MAKCRQCQLEKELAAFYISKKTKLPVPVCRQCNKDNYEKKKHPPNGICIECQKIAHIASNRMCKACLKSRGLKECKKCKNVDIKEIHFPPRGAVCRICKTPDNHLTKQEKATNARLLRTYGITLEKREEMEQAQAGKCAICKQKKSLVIDHNHQTGEIRALICQNCNAGLGFFFEKIDLLKQAISYLGGTTGEIVGTRIETESSIRIKRLETERQATQSQLQALQIDHQSLENKVQEHNTLYSALLNESELRTLIQTLIQTDKNPATRKYLNGLLDRLELHIKNPIERQEATRSESPEPERDLHGQAPENKHVVPPDPLRNS